jgi:hypothetical protein
MNLQEILFIARARLKDLSVKKWSEAELIAAVNEGICDMSSIIRQAREDYFLTSTTSTVATAVPPNPSSVTLPTDFLELKELMITNDGYRDISFLASDRSNAQFRRALLDGGSLGSGTGLVFYDIYANSVLMLSPGFDVALELKIDYIQQVPDLALPTDSPSLIPDKWHNNIPDYAVTEALRAAGDPRFTSYLEKLRESEKSMAVGIQPRQVREAKFVKGFGEDSEW